MQRVGPALSDAVMVFLLLLEVITSIGDQSFIQKIRYDLLRKDLSIVALLMGSTFLCRGMAPSFPHPSADRS